MAHQHNPIRDEFRQRRRSSGSSILVALLPLCLLQTCGDHHMVILKVGAPQDVVALVSVFLFSS